MQTTGSLDALATLEDDTIGQATPRSAILKPQDSADVITIDEENGGGDGNNNNIPIATIAESSD